MIRVDWSKLYCELLGEIALKLDCLEDVVNFSVVCSSWHRAYIMIKKKWTAGVPLLLLPENTEENPKYLRKLFCPNKRRCYELELPETFGARCWGTSSGWVVTIDLSLELYMFNPFTGARIRLPPQPTMPFKRKDKIDDFDWIRNKYVDKTYVCDLSNGDFVVVALHGGLFHSKIAYVKPGDEAWTLVTTLKKCVHDVVRLGTQLLVVFHDGVVGYCDMPTFQKSQPPIVVRDYLPTPPIKDFLPRVPHRRFYLLECLGHLLLVYRYKETLKSNSAPNTWDKVVCYRTKGFDVYLFNFDTKIWKIVENLGNVALFVGNNCTMAVDAATNNIKCNCIYFTDDETILWNVPILYGGHDMGVYDLEKKEIEPVYEGDDIRSKFCPAIWILPSLFC